MVDEPDLGGDPESAEIPLLRDDDAALDRRIREEDLPEEGPQDPGAQPLVQEGRLPNEEVEPG
jgi:hypothetical protein